MTVKIGQPIDPDMLRAIPDRSAQLNFLRAAVYALGRDAAPRLPRAARSAMGSRWDSADSAQPA
jgi:hypothetical protein